MSSWEKPWRSERSQRRRKTPSFSSSLLEAIYHSIDESRGEAEEEKETSFAAAYGRNNNNGGGVEVEEEITSLRRAIMLEKWMESYTRRHFNSDSSSSTDSSLFSSSETESAASRSTPKSSIFTAKKADSGREKTAAAAAAATLCGEGNQKREGRFMRTKSRALKIYGDLKKVKQPISPGGKIANFLNSIFNSRSNNTMKKHPAEGIEDWSSVRKSRSVKDSTMASRSCLNKTPSSRTKSKRSVRFCPVSVILDEDCQPCGHKNTYETHNPTPYITTDYINSNTFQNSEPNNIKNHRNSRAIYSSSDDEEDEDDRSCTSSDLFELENVGSFSRVVDASAAVDELPVYGTTSLKLNQAIANGLRS